MEYKIIRDSEEGIESWMNKRIMGAGLAIVIEMSQLKAMTTSAVVAGKHHITFVSSGKLC